MEVLLAVHLPNEDIVDEVRVVQKVDTVVHHQEDLLVEVIVDEVKVVQKVDTVEVLLVEATEEARLADTDHMIMIIIRADLLVEMRMVDIAVNNSERGLSESSFSCFGEEFFYTHSDELPVFIHAFRINPLFDLLVDFLA